MMVRLHSKTEKVVRAIGDGELLELVEWRLTGLFDSV